MSHFDNQTPYVPTYPPALGSQKLMDWKLTTRTSNIYTRKSQDKSANLWKKNVTKWNTREV